MLERLVLQCRNATADKLARLNSKSGDSLGGLSPPTRGKIISLDASAFVKSFKPDGRPKKEGKSSVVLKKKPLCKYDNADAKDTKWCDHSLPTNFHDIYYHRGAITEKLEEKSDRLKARLLQTETSSTCTLEQAHSPASITLSPFIRAKTAAHGRKEPGLAESPSPRRIVCKAAGRSVHISSC